MPRPAGPPKRLLKLIRRSYANSGGSHGSPRVFLDLREEGERDYIRSVVPRTVDDLPDGPLVVAAEGASGPEPERYPAPRRLRVRGDGVTGEVVLGREILRMDPMRVIPQPFRWWLSRQSAPRRSWHEAVLRIHAEGSDPAPLYEGDAVVAVTWLDPAR